MNAFIKVNKQIKFNGFFFKNEAHLEKFFSNYFN